MKVTSITINAQTGEATKEIVDLLVISAADAQEFDRLAAIEAANAEIRAALEANDLKAIRALLEGDSVRIEEIRLAQAALRSRLVQL